MMRKVRVVDSGDTDFLIGDRVDHIHFQSVNAVLKAEGKRVATAKPVLWGLRKHPWHRKLYFSCIIPRNNT